MTPVDLAAYYRAKAEVGIDLGPSFRTLGALWSRPGEALGEVSLPDSVGRSGQEIHPLLLDGCFQVMGAARAHGGSDADVTYLPFGWDRLEVPERLPDRLLCHVRTRGGPGGANGELPEVVTADIALCDLDGTPIGTLGRIHGETCDASRAARRRWKGSRNCSTRSHGATAPCRRACCRPTSSRARRPRRPARNRSPGIWPMRESRSRTKSTCKGKWNGRRGATRFRPWKRWGGSAGRALPWTRRSCASASRFCPSMRICFAGCWKFWPVRACCRRRTRASR